MKPLKDLVILEAASVLAGPSVGMFFAELGARVIKVEPPKGDVTRSWKLPSEDASSSVSAYFSSINFGKEYIGLDLKSEIGRKELALLIKEADVIITNNPSAQAEKLGLDKNTIRSLNPSIIHGHLRGFAISDRVAYDVVLQAETGYISMTGNGDDKAKLPIAMIDVLAGHQLKEGLLLALLESKGAYVEVSLEEAALAGLINQASNQLMEGHLPEAIGTKHPNIAPYGDLFKTRDGGSIILACGAQKHWELLCNELDIEELLTDMRFATNRDRLSNRAKLVALLADQIAQRDSKELMEKLNDRGIPAGMVNDLQQVLQGETARSMVLDEIIENSETKRLKGNVFRIETYDPLS